MVHKSKIIAISLILVLALAPAASFAQATAPKMVALVIGNKSYPPKGQGDLPGADNDAMDMAIELRSMGFKISNEKLIDLTRKEMNFYISKFLTELRPDSIAVIYYSGHGLEDRGENFLVPIDANVSSSADVAGELIPLNYVLQRLKRITTRTQVVILDACRNMPEMLRAKENGGSGGLARIEDLGPGIRLVYAASPGEKALPAPPNQRNSIFTAALLRASREMTSVSFDDIINRAGEITLEETGGRQKPWSSGTLGMSFRPIRPERNYISSQSPASSQTATAMPFYGSPQITSAFSLPKPSPANKLSDTFLAARVAHQKGNTGDAQALYTRLSQAMPHWYAPLRAIASLACGSAGKDKYQIFDDVLAWNQDEVEVLKCKANAQISNGDYLDHVITKAKIEEIVKNRPGQGSGHYITVVYPNSIFWRDNAQWIASLNLFGNMFVVYLRNGWIAADGKIIALRVGVYNFNPDPWKAVHKETCEVKIESEKGGAFTGGTLLDPVPAPNIECKFTLLDSEKLSGAVIVVELVGDNLGTSNMFSDPIP